MLLEAKAPYSCISAHLPTLYVLALDTKEQLIELGVGCSTVALLEACEVSGNRLTSYDHDPESKNRVVRLSNSKMLERWTFISKNSVESANLHENCSVGLLFIDTRHSLEQTRKELEAWLPKMSNTGIICGHDYYLKIPGSDGVERAVTEFHQKHRKRFNLKVFPNDCGLFVLHP
jgi:hypothetical protein